VQIIMLVLFPMRALFNQDIPPAGHRGAQRACLHVLPWLEKLLAAFSWSVVSVEFPSAIGPLAPFSTKSSLYPTLPPLGRKCLKTS